MLNVNPTRMELSNLKARLTMAKRGHKLLKDKLDEMIKIFMELLDKVKENRKKVDEILNKTIDSFIITKSNSFPEILEAAYLVPWQKCEIKEKLSHLIGIKIFDFDVSLQQNSEYKNMQFQFFHISKELKKTINLQTKLLFNIIKLSETEFKLNILGNEIAKTRRRVNALEYQMIPEILETIKMISSKIEENERSTLVRIMKVKDIVRENSI
ncbi:MAG: V-type ATP synthase subunit D [Elusimicrobiota bacterium]|jgi:V/A-type H+-transporting ATPase subunit D|nr:V-type ATP synthase subunit D [Elusimicrobiota bacterium]